MLTTGILPTITASPFLSAFIWIILILVAMYLARKPFHRCMASFGLIIRNGLRLFAASVNLAEKRLNNRNREVLLNAGRQHAKNHLACWPAMTLRERKEHVERYLLRHITPGREYVPEG